MESNYAILERQKRMDKIMRTLKEAKNKGVSVSYEKFIGEAGVVWGLSSKKVSEYLHQLEQSKHIKRGVSLFDGVEEETLEAV